jgi:hypothetical protein
LAIYNLPQAQVALLHARLLLLCSSVFRTNFEFAHPKVLAVHLVLFCPRDRAFFKIYFGLANGPLLGAIVLYVGSVILLISSRWQNRLVFHDIDKLTSLFIHIMPALLSYCIRWCDPEMFAGATSEEIAVSMSDIGIMMLFYILWQVCCIF